MLYKFNIVLYSGGDTPSDAFSNLLSQIASTGMQLEEEVIFEEVAHPTGSNPNLAVEEVH